MFINSFIFSGCQITLTKDMEGMEVQLPQATRNFYVDGHKPKPHWVEIHFKYTLIYEQIHVSSVYGCYCRVVLGTFLINTKDFVSILKKKCGKRLYKCKLFYDFNTEI